MIKSYNYSLKTTNGMCFVKLSTLFEEFNIDCGTLIEADECENKLIHIILYSEDDIDNCVNKDEFLDKLEDLAIKYHL